MSSFQKLHFICVEPMGEVIASQFMRLSQPQIILRYMTYAACFPLCWLINFIILAVLFACWVLAPETNELICFNLILLLKDLLPLA